MRVNKILKSLSIIGMVLFVILIYTVLHEGGHAIAVLIQGGSVITFDVNFLFGNPHISYSGVFTDGGRALISIAGILFPVLVWIPVVPIMKNFKNTYVKLILILFSVSVIGSLLPNIFLPIGYYFGFRPQGEDIVSFLDYSGFNPMLVSFLFLFLIVLSIYYTLHVGNLKKLYHDIIQSRELKNLRKLNIKSRFTILMLIIALIIPFLFRTINPQTGVDFSDYDTIVETNLSNLSNDRANIRTFDVVDLLIYDFAYSVQTEEPLEIVLRNLSGEEFLFTNSDRVTIFEGSEDTDSGVFSNFLLEPSTYSVSLSLESTQNEGVIKFGIRSREPTEDDFYYYDIFRSIKNNEFSEDTYIEEGYNLKFMIDDFEDFTNKTEIPLEINSNEIFISVFLVGHAEEFSLSYQDGSKRIDFLENTIATIGLKTKVDRKKGSFYLKANGSENLRLYLYIKENN